MTSTITIANTGEEWTLGFPGGADGEESACMQMSQVWSPDGEDPLEKAKPTRFSMPAWRIPWTEEPSGLQSVGSQRVRHDWAINTFILKRYTNLKRVNPES